MFVARQVLNDNRGLSTLTSAAGAGTGKFYQVSLLSALQREIERRIGHKP
jgi:hypothetical protein